MGDDRDIELRDEVGRAAVLDELLSVRRAADCRKLSACCTSLMLDGVRPGIASDFRTSGDACKALAIREIGARRFSRSVFRSVA